MGAFTHFISGLAGGSAKEFSQISEEKRKNKFRQDELIGAALEEKLKDPNITPDEADQLLRSRLKLGGMDNKTIEQIASHAGYMRQALKEKESVTPQPGLQGPNEGSGEGTIPPVPQMRTLGEMNFEQGLSQRTRTLKATGEAATELEEGKKSADIRAWASVFKELTGRAPTPDEIKIKLGMVQKGGATRPVAGTVQGKDYIEKFPVDMAGQPTTGEGQYKLILNTQNGEPEGIVPVTTRAYGGEWVKLEGSSTGFGHVYRDSTGRVTKVEKDILPPAGYLESTSTSQTFKTVQQPDGSTALVPVTESRTTGKDLPETPSTSGTPGRITPSTPLPTAPSQIKQPTGPDPYKSSFRVGQIVGGKPLTQGEFTALNNARQGLRSIEKMKEKLAKDPAVLAKAAIPGSPGARLFTSYKKELADIITRLRTGAALNEEEQRFYQGQMPSVLDLVGQSMEPGLINAKLKIYEDLFHGVAQQSGRRAVGGYMPGAFSPEPRDNKGRPPLDQLLPR